MAKRRRSMVLIMFFLFLASVFCTGEIGMMPAETTMVQSEISEIQEKIKAIQNEKNIQSDESKESKERESQDENLTVQKIYHASEKNVVYVYRLQLCGEDSKYCATFQILSGNTAESDTSKGKINTTADSKISTETDKEEQYTFVIHIYYKRIISVLRTILLGTGGMIQMKVEFDVHTEKKHKKKSKSAGIKN